MERYVIRVYGHVQGVVFRSSARNKANKLGLNGYVKNEPDGSVYIEAEGPKADLQTFLAWCHKGPKYANVASLNYSVHDPVGYQLFLIK